jgi:uncharacterized membrane protein YdbT with pleckstrin-like domain
MRPNYVAKKSLIPALSFWLIAFSWLLIPLIIQIKRILSAKYYSIEFYDNKIIVKSGILNMHERQSVFAGVHSISISQSLFGRIFNYGNIYVDCPGKWDIDTKGIKNPESLKKYLEGYITSKGMTNIIFD